MASLMIDNRDDKIDAVSQFLDDNLDCFLVD